MKRRNTGELLRQWDAFFKEIASNSRALRVEVAKVLGANEHDLIPTARHDAEYRSCVVAEALHHKGPYKEFIVDGLFKTKAYPAFGYEYQRTYNSGIPLRTLMYEIAVRETIDDLPEGGVQFIVLYSGAGLSRVKARQLHGRRLARFTSTRFVDLNLLDRTALTTSDIYSHILALAREDADVDLFFAANEWINREGPVRGRDRLRKALVAAAAGRPDILKALRGLSMDAEIQKSLDVLLDSRKYDYAKEMLLKIAKATKDAPFDLSVLVNNCDLEDVFDLADKIIHASGSKDWSELYSVQFRQAP